MTNGYTPIERKLLDMLSDGRPHHRAELHALAWDRQDRLQNMQIHISNLRKKLRPKGRDIVCEVRKAGLPLGTSYQLVRLLSDPNDGKS